MRRARGLSQRRTCTLLSGGALGAGLPSAQTRVRRGGAGADVASSRARYPRYGYRRIRVFLGRDGHRMSAGRAYRLWRAAGLQMPRKRPRRRVAASRPRPQAPHGGEPGVVLRLRVRPLRQRAAAQVSDGDRRVHQGGTGDRRRRPHPLAARDRGAVASRQRARRAGLPTLSTTARSSYRRRCCPGSSRRGSARR